MLNGDSGLTPCWGPTGIAWVPSAPSADWFGEGLFGNYKSSSPPFGIMDDLGGSPNFLIGVFLATFLLVP